MSSWDIERRQKLNQEFDNVYREHDRLQKDLNTDQQEHYQSFIKSIDKWEQDAIVKIQKTAQNARDDLHRLFNDTQQQLRHVLNDAVTEELRDALKQKNNFTEYQIDKWLSNLSEIRRQLEAIASAVEFSSNKSINLIKVKRKYPLDEVGRIYLDYKQFYFELIRGHPNFCNAEHLISSNHPATILSQNKYTTGTHYFRFRIELANEELFFGIISDRDKQKLKKNHDHVQSIYGWWNIDRRVIAGRKEPYVSSLNIYNGDEVILVINCDAGQLLLEYPSMVKLNSIQKIDDIRDCPRPWKVLIEIGKPGTYSIRLLDWGKLSQMNK